jgi:hypothetical protein
MPVVVRVEMVPRSEFRLFIEEEDASIDDFESFLSWRDTLFYSL